MAETGVNGRTLLLIIGGSAGSLGLIVQILQQLSSAAYPVVIVIHRGHFEGLLSELLIARAGANVKEVEDKERLEAGVVYLAPADYHILFEKEGMMSLDVSEKVNFCRPSIDVAFESAAAVLGSGVTGVLLSGANSDGGAGLRAVQEAGGLTIVQDPATAEVPYMPAYALSLFTPRFVVPADKIPALISQL